MMQIIRVPCLVILTCLPFVVVCSESTSAAQSPPDNDTASNKASRPKKRPQAETFERDLFRQLSSDDNLIYSPISVLISLRIAMAGAKGETAREIESVIGLMHKHKDRMSIGKDVENDEGRRLTLAS